MTTTTPTFAQAIRAAWRPVSREREPTSPLVSRSTARIALIVLSQVATHARDVLEALDSAHDPGELGDRLDLEGHPHRRRVVRRYRDAGGDDVHPVLRDDLGDVVEEPRSVERLDGQGDRVRLGGSRFPFDLDETVDLPLVHHGRARAKVDRDTFAPGDEADDRVARDGVAALGEAAEEVPDALGANAAAPLDLGR